MTAEHQVCPDGGNCNYHCDDGVCYRVDCCTPFLTIGSWPAHLFTRCYLCKERVQKTATEKVAHTVSSAARGGTVAGVKRYVRMCRADYGCKAPTYPDEAL